MPYVERDAENNIVGIYNVPQPGIAEELLADNDPEVITFRKPTPKAAAPLTAEELAAHLVTKTVITQGEIDAIKASR